MRIFLFVNILLIITLARPVTSRALTNEVIRISDTAIKWDVAYGADFEKDLYRATFDISKHHLTGFIFIKKVSDTSFRILFSNEFGMRFFDFEFSEKEFIVHYCFPSLDRKSLLNLLNNDFRILLFPNHGIKKIIPDKSGTAEETIFKIKKQTGKWIFRISAASKKILAIQSMGKVFSKTRIDIVHSDELVTRLDISNPLIKLRLTMTRINS